MNHAYHIHNHELEECNVMKYLGVLIDNNLTWSAHTDYIDKKAMYISWFKTLNTVHVMQNLSAFYHYTVVHPILEHASIICSSYHAVNSH